MAKGGRISVRTLAGVLGLLIPVRLRTTWTARTMPTALYYGMNESYTHASVRPVAWAYALSVLVGVALSVPYWRVLGLLG